MAESDPVSRYIKIRKELEMYSSDLLNKKETVVATKIDSILDSSHLDSLEDYCKKNDIVLLKISSVTGEGIKTLLNYLAKELKEM